MLHNSDKIDSESESETEADSDLPSVASPRSPESELHSVSSKNSTGRRSSISASNFKKRNIHLAPSISTIQNDDRTLNRIRWFRRITDPKLTAVYFFSYIIIYIIIFGIVFGVQSPETQNRWCTVDRWEAVPTLFLVIVTAALWVCYSVITLWAIVQWISRQVRKRLRKIKRRSNLNNNNNNNNNNDNNFISTINKNENQENQENKENKESNESSLASNSAATSSKYGSSSQSSDYRWDEVHDPLHLRPQAFVFAIGLTLNFISAFTRQSILEFYTTTESSSEYLPRFLIAEIVGQVGLAVNYLAVLGYPVVVALLWRRRRKNIISANQDESPSSLNSPPHEGKEEFHSLPWYGSHMEASLRSDPKLRSLFRRYCKQEFSTENIAFWERVQIIQGMNQSPETQIKEIQEIVDLFIRSGSAMEINTTHSVRNEIIHALDTWLKSFSDKTTNEHEDHSFDMSMFNRAMDEVVKNMTDTWTRFIETSEFKRHIKKIHQEQVEDSLV